MKDLSDIVPRHQSQQSLIVKINISFLIISSIFLFLRVYSRTAIQKTWKLDDSILSSSWIFLVGYLATSSIQTKYGAGKHMSEVPKSALVPFLFCTYLGLMFYNLYNWSLKSSIALLYLRIFSLQPSNKVRYTIIGLIVFTSLSQWMLIFVVAFACQPISFAWDKSIDGYCINVNPFFFVSTVSNTFIDLLLIVIAVPHVITLPLPRPEKIGVLLVVNLGWLTIGACIARTLMLGKAIVVEDFTWHILEFTVWSGIECAIGMICATAAVIKPLLQKLWRPWFRSPRSQSSHEELAFKT